MGLKYDPDILDLADVGVYTVQLCCCTFSRASSLSVCLPISFSPSYPSSLTLSLPSSLPSTFLPYFPASLSTSRYVALRCAGAAALCARASARAYKEKGREGLGEEVFDEGYFSTTHTRLCVAKSESHQIVQLDDAFVVLLSRARNSRESMARARERERVA